MRFFLFIPLFLFVFSFAYGVPLDGEKVFTVQVASLRDEGKAEEVAKDLLDRGFKDVWIKHVNDRFRVRVGFFDTKEEAVEFTKKLREKGLKGYYVTLVEFTRRNVRLFQPRGEMEGEPSEGTGQVESRLEKSQEKVPGVRSVRNDGFDSDKWAKLEKLEERRVKVIESRENKVVKSGSEEDKTVNSKVVPAVKKEEKKLSQKEDRSDLGNGSSWKYLPFVLLFLVLVPFYSFLFRRNESRAVSFEKYLLNLLEDGKCEKLVETALPFIEKNETNTFVRELVARCYARQGKWLEAASMYKEISEILREKGLLELSEKMEKKFEELSAREFMKGGGNPLL